MQTAFSYGCTLQFMYPACRFTAKERDDAADDVNGANGLDYFGGCRRQVQRPISELDRILSHLSKLGWRKMVAFPLQKDEPFPKTLRL